VACGARWLALMRVRNVRVHVYGFDQDTINALDKAARGSDAKWTSDATLQAMTCRLKDRVGKLIDRIDALQEFLSNVGILLRDLDNCVVLL
jgi:hypothetical protein